MPFVLEHAASIVKKSTINEKQSAEITYLSLITDVQLGSTIFGRVYKIESCFIVLSFGKVKKIKKHTHFYIKKIFIIFGQ